MKNFFEHQDTARRNTLRLVVLFGLAVLVTIVAVYFVALVAIEGAALWKGQTEHLQRASGWDLWWNLDAFSWASMGTLLLVGGGTWWKIHQLAEGGGSLVCEQLGGRFLDFRTDDLKEQQLINVVQEMSIASGMSVPLLYVLDHEPGINAFAAGFSPNNAAIAVSRGCLDLLDRDELQGVIAHEFSHILNGDMRMNIRMIGILHGILMLALTGRFLIRMGAGGARTRSRSSRDGGGVYFIALGAALFVIGYVGRFFGQVIKSAISRQREFLADASAVQFTRNPDGISGALQKIGGYAHGSHIDSSNADEISHLFFGNALEESWLDSLFATHPPLPDRIRRVDPSFHGAFPTVEAPAQLESDQSSAASPLSGQKSRGQRVAALGAAGMSAARAADGGQPQKNPAERVRLNADQVVGQAGYARGALEAIPEPIREAARESYSAAAVVFALLIDVDISSRTQQLDILGRQLTAPLVEEVRRHMYLLEKLDPRYRLPLVEILVPGLRQMSDKQHDQFVDILDKLIYADNEVSLFEFSLEKLLKHRLEASHGEGGRRVAQYYSMTPLRRDVAALLSCLAYVGHDGFGEAQVAFRQGASCLGSMRNKIELLARAECSLTQLEPALDRIAQSTNAIKQKVVEATAHCVLADEEVTVEEAELLRAICEVIDVPLPPFLPGLSEDAAS